MYKAFLVDFLAQNETDRWNLEDGRVKLNPSYIINMGDFNDEIPIHVDTINSTQRAFLYKAKNVNVWPGDITVPVNFLIVDDNVVENMNDNVTIIDFRTGPSFYEMVNQNFNDKLSTDILNDGGLINRISSFSYVLESYNSKKY